ncbi:uncharacterized protein MONOS_18121 [Monocercomonoides exilis]|uniref:uncharacterized protein n=1 Tax=Monocercomonoides exilis TaxID=2049356 RepID=UPI00355A6201|nr:hypothetical protein MONOS_18117 [Monocercomonoides exilis]KAH7817568.1 hypothetical protein MONOS_18121 [Monocercomonoides exilis]
MKIPPPFPLDVSLFGTVHAEKVVQPAVPSIRILPPPCSKMAMPPPLPIEHAHPTNVVFFDANVFGELTEAFIPAPLSCSDFIFEREQFTQVRFEWSEDIAEQAENEKPAISVFEIVAVPPLLQQSRGAEKSAEELLADRFTLTESSAIIPVEFKEKRIESLFDGSCTTVKLEAVSDPVETANSGCKLGRGAELSTVFSRSTPLTSMLLAPTSMVSGSLSKTELIRIIEDDSQRSSMVNACVTVLHGLPSDTPQLADLSFPLAPSA